MCHSAPEKNMEIVDVYKILWAILFKNATYLICFTISIKKIVVFSISIFWGRRKQDGLSLEQRIILGISEN